MAEEMISMKNHHEAMKKNTDFYLGVIGSQAKSLRELQASYDTLLQEKQEQEEYTYELHIKELHYYDLQKMYKELKQERDEYEAQIEKMREEGKQIFNDWLEACNKYGIVNLRLTEAKEIMSSMLNAMKRLNVYKTQGGIMDRAEAFLKE